MGSAVRKLSYEERQTLRQLISDIRLPVAHEVERVERSLASQVPITEKEPWLLRKRERAEPMTGAAHSEVPLQCPECEFTTSSPQGLGAHKRSVHGIRGGGDKAHRRSSANGSQPKPDKRKPVIEVAPVTETLAIMANDAPLDQITQITDMIKYHHEARLATMHYISELRDEIGIGSKTLEVVDDNIREMKERIGELLGMV